jgi:hypothetical protein
MSSTDSEKKAQAQILQLDQSIHGDSITMDQYGILKKVLATYFKDKLILWILKNNPLFPQGLRKNTYLMVRVTQFMLSSAGSACSYPENQRKINSSSVCLHFGNALSKNGRSVMHCPDLSKLCEHDRTMSSCGGNISAQEHGSS